MKYFPNYLTTLPYSVSASISSQSLFLNNFSGTLVNTASLALNISGAAGTNGTSVTVNGPRGPQGFTGIAGEPGDGIYMLPSSSAVGCVCSAFTGGPAVFDGTLYTGAGCTSPSIEYRSYSNPLQNGSILYTNAGCSIKASDGLYVSASLVFSATAGVVTQVGACSV